MQYFEKVRDLTINGTDGEEAEVVGYHGTSLQALRYLAEHGKMPTSGALKNVFCFNSIKRERAKQMAEGYAGINAVRNRLIIELQEKAKGKSRELDQAFILEVVGAMEDRDLLTTVGHKIDSLIEKILDILGINRGGVRKVI